MQWFLSWLSLSKAETRTIAEGERIHTRFGMGTIVGGTIRVKYDRRLPGLPDSNREWTHDMREVTKDF